MTDETIIAFLADNAARIVCGYCWLVANRCESHNNRGVMFTVYERGIYAKKTTVVYVGENLASALAALRED